MISKVLEICGGKSSERYENEGSGVLENLQSSKQGFAIIIFNCLPKALGKQVHSQCLKKVYE